MFKCNLCEKEFQNIRALSSHQSFHKVINESCKVCDKIFTSQHALNGHMVWHNKAHRDRINKINENTTKKHQASIEEYNKNPKNCEECNSIISYNDYVFKSSHLKRNSTKHIFCSRKCSGSFSKKELVKSTNKEYTCLFCNKIYTDLIKLKSKYCSNECNFTHKSTGFIKLQNKENYLNNPSYCKQCNNYIPYDKITQKCHTFRSVNNIFCNGSCRSSYLQAHKTFGYNRSKLELEIEKDITQKYPSLEIHYNRRDTILAELDVYIPSLKIAFELNGIFHYEPIYGNDKLEKTINNDNRKLLACTEKEIELCVIDSSGLKSMRNKKEVTKYLNIVTSIIDQKTNRLNQANGL